MANAPRTVREQIRQQVKLLLLTSGKATDLQSLSEAPLPVRAEALKGLLCRYRDGMRDLQELRKVRKNRKSMTVPGKNIKGLFYQAAMAQVMLLRCSVELLGYPLLEPPEPSDLKNWADSLMQEWLGPSRSSGSRAFGCA